MCFGIGDHDLCRASRVILLFFANPKKTKNGNNTNQEMHFSHSHSFFLKSSPSLAFSVISYSKQERKKWG
ncbi:hypothetical protein GHT06_011157 [Daphnia sinensis]|uniref:Uncharacterized protein n=1 Tax=Daphnia sinensis TaxID=1820382 RepID=A0AAD5LJZ2_9CRUS|nr:hypothetical protein GHT06_011157 [Daphnia sinensis]